MEKFKQKLKKTTAMLMIAVLLIGIAPIGSLADVEWSEFAFVASAEQEVLTVTEGFYTFDIYILEDITQAQIKGEATLVNVENENITIDDAFLEIPSEIRGVPVTTIGSRAFAYCYNIYRITIPDTVTVIEEEAFYQCRNLSQITLPDSITRVGANAFKYTEWWNVQPDGLLYLNKVLVADKGYEPPSDLVVVDGTKVIANNAFDHSVAYENYPLTNVYLPKSIKHIGDEAFNNCDGIRNVYIDSLDTWFNIEFGHNANPLSYADNFYVNKLKTTKITVPDTVNEIKNYAFESFTGLTEITISGLVKTIGKRAFRGCINLKSVTIKNGLKHIAWEAFYGCDALQEITIPNSLISTETYAFAYCYNLNKVNISDLRAWLNIDFGINEDDLDPMSNPLCYDATLYLNGAKVENLVIPDGVTRIKELAFVGCDGLRSVMLPESVTEIDSFAFAWCNYLIGVIIPKSVVAINSSAFMYAGNWFTDDGCPAYYRGNASQWETINFGENVGLDTPVYNYELDHVHDYDLNGNLMKFDDGIVIQKGTCISKEIKRYRCKRCNYTYDVEWADDTHNYVTIPAKAATYTSTGLTTGERCSLCGKITIPQQTIAKLTLGKVDGLKAKKVKVAKKSEINLTWNSVGEGVKYEVYQKNGKKWKKIKTTDKTSYTVKKLKADKEYQFRVRAVVDDIKGKYSSTLRVETIPSTATLKLKAGKKQLTASWSKVSDISGYEVQYSTSKKMKSAKTVNVKKSSKKTTIKKLSKGKKYYVRVRTYKTVNGKKIYSDWSKVKSVKVK